MKYRIYDLDANLIKEIIPSQSIQIEENEENNIPSINGDGTDFSVICRVIDNKIIAYNYTGPIECNTDTGQCKYTVQWIKLCKFKQSFILQVDESLVRM